MCCSHSRYPFPHPFTSLFPLPPHPPHRPTRAPPGPPPPHFSGHIAPKTTIVWPRTTPVARNAQRAPPAPHPAPILNPRLNSTQQKKGCPPPLPRANMWPPTGEWSVYIGPTGTIDEHMAQFVEQTSQTRPHQPPHHHLASPQVVRTTHPPNLFAYPPRSRRGTNWYERRGHTGRIHMNAAYFQHRPPYSNTARRRPDTRRGCSRESTGS